MEAKKLIQAIEAAGYDVRDYSGRGMYGRSCVGVDVDRDFSEYRFALEVAREALALCEDGDGQSVLDELAELRTESDQMGRGAIVYFPDVRWPEGAPLEDEFEDDAPEDALQQGA